MKFIEVDRKEGITKVKINPKIFPMDIIYSAAYALIDRAYVILDGDPEKEVYAILKPRNFEGSLEELGRAFYDELINFAFYAVQVIRNRDIREALIKVAAGEEEENFEDIATVWEKKFGVDDESAGEEGK